MSEWQQKLIILNEWVATKTNYPKWVSGYFISKISLDGIVKYEWWMWVSEWLLFNANSSIFHLYHEQVNFQWNDYAVHFVLDQHAESDFHNASSLKQQSTDRHVTPLGHIILIPSQPVFTLSP
jgi:hypothetical protein